MVTRVSPSPSGSAVPARRRSGWEQSRRRGDEAGAGDAGSGAGGTPVTAGSGDGEGAAAGGGGGGSSGTIARGGELGRSGAAPWSVGEKVAGEARVATGDPAVGEARTEAVGCTSRIVTAGSASGERGEEAGATMRLMSEASLPSEAAATGEGGGAASPACRPPRLEDGTGRGGEGEREGLSSDPSSSSEWCDRG